MCKEVPLLKFLTATRTVRILWSEYNVQNSVAKYFFLGDRSHVKWNSIEEGLELKIKNDLILPKELKIILSSLVKPIGGRIKNVIRQIYGKAFLPNNFMSMISWTILGIIDKKKTAEAVIKDEDLPFSMRYEIACTYCMYDQLPMLCSKLHKKNKNCHSKVRGHYMYTFPIYWAYRLKKELNILDRRFREEYNALNSDFVGLAHAFSTDNLPAFEYLLGKLSAEEKEIHVNAFFLYLEVSVATISNGDYACDIIYFLLSHVSENERKRLMEKCAYYILKCFLKFPYLGLFLETEIIMQKYLTTDQKEALRGHEQYKETSKYFVFRTFSKNNVLWNF
ncbi:ANK_REP_REGION domain-containing protein [Trichonephila clavipes]|nr:ANK_REP_REGION domain-containing protein [Trichonephila clavipes]